MSLLFVSVVNLVPDLHIPIHNNFVLGHWRFSLQDNIHDLFKSSGMCADLTDTSATVECGSGIISSSRCNSFGNVRTLVVSLQ